MLTKLHMNLATLGHVDHGKTTLTAAITAYAAKLGRANAETYDKIDAAPKEKTQGLITNTAHVAYETENIVYSQIDCPSHDDYVKNLICGSVRLDAAVLVVSAPDGPMPQTRAQILLASQVGIPSIIVYLNKCDQMDDEEQLMLVEEEVRELLNKYGFPGYTTPLIRGSAVQALNREASEYGVKSIQKLLEALDSNVVPDPHGDEDSPFLMPIEEVFAITGRGTLVTGKIDTGKVKVGDEVEIVGLKAARKAIVIGTEMYNKAVPVASAGSNAGTLLQGITKEEVERGMVLAKPSSIKSHRKFKAVVYVRNKEEGGRSTPFCKGNTPLFFFRTIDVTGSVQYICDGDDVSRPIEIAMSGDYVNIEANLISNIALSVGLKFAIREGGRSIASGTITEILV